VTRWLAQSLGTLMTLTAATVAGLGPVAVAIGCDGAGWRERLTLSVSCPAPAATGGQDAATGSRHQAVVVSAATAPRSDADGNLAAGRPTSASSGPAGSPPAQAVDASIDTAWRTRGATAWWQVDLERTTEVSAVILNWDAHGLPTGYSLLLSKNGQAWQRAGKAHGRPEGGPTALQLRADPRARFLRVETEQPVRAADGIALRDVRVFSGAAPEAQRVDRSGAVGRIPAGGQPGVSDDAALPPVVAEAVAPGSERGEAAGGTGFGLDPLTTAALVVIVAAGATSLAIGHGESGRHRRRMVRDALRGRSRSGTPPAS
jgi:hypothetical protein